MVVEKQIETQPQGRYTQGCLCRVEMPAKEMENFQARSHRHLTGIAEGGLKNCFMLSVSHLEGSPSDLPTNAAPAYFTLLANLSNCCICVGPQQY